MPGKAVSSSGSLSFLYSPTNDPENRINLQIAYLNSQISQKQKKLEEDVEVCRRCDLSIRGDGGPAVGGDVLLGELAGRRA